MKIKIIGVFVSDHNEEWIRRTLLGFGVEKVLPLKEFNGYEIKIINKSLDLQPFSSDVQKIIDKLNLAIEIGKIKTDKPDSVRIVRA